MPSGMCKLSGIEREVLDLQTVKWHFLGVSRCMHPDLKTKQMKYLQISRSMKEGSL